ncbi:MAG TPA: signal peptidase I [Dermatophilaceae bacterium]
MDHQHSRHRWLVVIGAALVLMMLVRGFLVESFYIPSGSMEPTLEPADRILVNKIGGASSLQRGDLVVFDGTHSFADRAAESESGSGIGRVLGSMASRLPIHLNESDYVKRVVGLPGDHVVCCDLSGLLTVNGDAVQEPYLFPGDKPSGLTFDVRVPAARIWVMGDHRSVSADSRAHLGDPGGGMVRLDDVIGRAGMIYWPPSRAGVLDAASSLKGAPAGAVPAGTLSEIHR